MREIAPSRPEAAVGAKEAEARSSSLADLQRTLRGDLVAILRQALAHSGAQRAAGSRSRVRSSMRVGRAMSRAKPKRSRRRLAFRRCPGGPDKPGRRRCVRSARGSASPASPMLWTDLSVAANTACMTDRYRECETLVREALKALGRNPSAADLRYTDARGVLALSLAGQGRRAEALPWIEETLRWNESAKRRPFYTGSLEAARGRQ